MLKKVVSHVGVGLAVGSVTSVSCMALMGGMDGTLKQVIAWLCASAILGLVSLIYDIESLPVPLAIGIHSAACLAVALGTACLLGYAAYFGSLFILIIPVFIVVYIAISLGIWLYGRYCAKTTNERLNKR